jgi:hypothetical protein
MTYDWEGRLTSRARWIKICLGVFATALVVLAVTMGSARAQTLTTVTGKCQKLVVGKKNYTSDCQRKLHSMSYPNGRVGFWFMLPNSTILSMAGQELPHPTLESGQTRVDQVVFQLKGAPTVSEPAVGKCTFSNPAKPMTVRCQGTLQSGDKFVAIFRTDGKAPR